MSQVIYIGIKLIKIPTDNPYQFLISDNAGISWDIIFEGSDLLGEFFELGNKGFTFLLKLQLGNFARIRKVVLGRG
ncbi:hypothetical protein [Kaistella palustris]|uniref:hypothetical protein n=1 Tax=Kaistella palustris TaxID=493376 RepID=UPI0004151AD1|nr:hypothetical protein [Kaistella palustris]